MSSNLEPAGVSIATEELPPPTLLRSWAYQARLPLTIAVVILGSVCALFSRPWIPQSSLWDLRLDSLGFLLLIAGILIRGWASRHISGRKSRAIVDTGPYALCRNPLYWGTFLIVLSQMLILRSLSCLLLFAAPVALYVWGVVPAEEAYLSRRLGTAYDDYTHRTPRWWPRWHARAWITPEMENRPAYERERISLVFWFFLPFATEWICHCRELPGWSAWCRLP